MANKIKIEHPLDVNVALEILSKNYMGLAIAAQEKALQGIKDDDFVNAKRYAKLMEVYIFRATGNSPCLDFCDL